MADCTCTGIDQGGDDPIDADRVFTLDRDGWRCSRCQGLMTTTHQQAATAFFDRHGLGCPSPEDLDGRVERAIIRAQPYGATFTLRLAVTYRTPA